MIYTEHEPEVNNDFSILTHQVIIWETIENVILFLKLIFFNQMNIRIRK